MDTDKESYVPERLFGLYRAALSCGYGFWVYNWDDFFYNRYSPRISRWSPGYIFGAVRIDLYPFKKNTINRETENSGSLSFLLWVIARCGPSRTSAPTEYTERLNRVTDEVDRNGLIYFPREHKTIDHIVGAGVLDRPLTNDPYDSNKQRIT